MDYEFTKVSRYDGTTRTETAIEVFNTMTGETICFCRRNFREAKDAWLKRAFERAAEQVAA